MTQSSTLDWGNLYQLAKLLFGKNDEENIALDLESTRIAVIGLGYVGLPLMVEFAGKYPTLGFDTKKSRITQLQSGIDITRELSCEELKKASLGSFSNEASTLADYNVFVITVPTPVDRQKRPDMSALQSACDLVGKNISPGDVIIFESTVYPGATEEFCVPTLEARSGLTFNTDFFVGYSPERINPGDKAHRLTDIIKVTSGSTPDTQAFVDALYASIIPAGTYPASSIKVAEAAKVIENTQRDLNIALINELCIIFHRLGIDTEEVLQAAGSKWNFLPFRPGMVGGHCISVDPYYLTYKSQEIGYHPEVILAGRRINDEMGDYISERVVKELTQRRIHVVDSRILIMGLAFKENCPDLRNTRVIDLITGLKEYNASVDVFDPWVEKKEAQNEFGINLIDEPSSQSYDAIIIAVTHGVFLESGLDVIRSYCKPQHVLFDVKYLFPASEGLCRL